MKPKLIFSCHADTGFRNHRLRLNANGDYYGHLDNFVGVFAMMNAYFSGQLDYPDVRIELTYGEETDMEGAIKVMNTLHSYDTVIVIDVTGTETGSDITIEKCSDPEMQDFVIKALEGLSYTMYEGCPDPVANEDESDVYKEKVRKVCFMGIPCKGGDYNAGMVTAKPESVKSATEAIIRLAKTFSGEN